MLIFSPFFDNLLSHRVGTGRDKKEMVLFGWLNNKKIRYGNAVGST